VIGVSSDSVARHAAFVGKHVLAFTLVSDQSGQVRKRYGVPAVQGSASAGTAAAAARR
jgi:peroxiredoxin Q/BCP